MTRSTHAAVAGYLCVQLCNHFAVKIQGNMHKNWGKHQTAKWACKQIRSYTSNFSLFYGGPPWLFFFKAFYAEIELILDVELRIV